MKGSPAARSRGIKKRPAKRNEPPIGVPRCGGIGSMIADYKDCVCSKVNDSPYLFSF
jgi:hypothetical protein